MASGFYRINFQPHHSDMDFVLRVRWMFGDVTLRDGGDEFFADIFRHALDVRNPRRAQPGRETFRAIVSRILRYELERVDLETKFGQPFFVITGRVKKYGVGIWRKNSRQRARRISGRKTVKTSSALPLPPQEIASRPPGFKTADMPRKMAR